MENILFFLRVCGLNQGEMLKKTKGHYNLIISAFCLGRSCLTLPPF